LKIYFYFISLLLVLFFYGCGGGNDANFTTNSDEESIVYTKNITGIVSKGLVEGATVEVTRVDTNELLGKSITDQNGSFSVNIGSFEGIIKVTAKGGQYKDELDGKIKDAKDLSLKAISVVDSKNNFSVVVTPFSYISAKNLDGVTDKERVISENKKISQLFLGDDVDITKIVPSIVGKDEIKDDLSGKLGTMLAAFTGIIDNNPSKINSKIDEIYQDYVEDGIVGETSQELYTVVSDSNFTLLATTPSLKELFKKEIVVEKIRDYADGNDSCEPILEDFITLGLLKVNSKNISYINNKIKEANPTQLDTIEKIKNIVDDLTSFKMLFETRSADESITIPTTGDGYNYTLSGETEAKMKMSPEI